MAERKAMINRTHTLPLVRQCQILELARSTAYYQPRPVSQDDLALMHRIDEWHLAYPCAGSRMQTTMLTREGTPGGASSRLHADEADGHPRPVSQAQHQHTTSGASDVSLPVAPSDDHPFQSRVGGGHHLHPDETRRCLPVRGPGLGQSPGVGVAAVQHADDRLLYGSRAGRDDTLWCARKLHHGPRLPVHQPGVHGAPDRPRASRSAWMGKAAGGTTCS